tara:strand:- start:833 stop:1021 length:189 start_codon:yes stop_codon:yes gene_type:complete
MIAGFYLMMVMILPDGMVTGEVLDYYFNPVECFAEAVELELEAEPGLAFTCVEDYVELGEGV